MGVWTPVTCWKPSAMGDDAEYAAAGVSEPSGLIRFVGVPYVFEGYVVGVTVPDGADEAGVRPGPLVANIGSWGANDVVVGGKTVAIARTPGTSGGKDRELCVWGAYGVADEYVVEGAGVGSCGLALTTRCGFMASAGSRRGSGTVEGIDTFGLSDCDGREGRPGGCRDIRFDGGSVRSSSAMSRFP